MSYGPPPGYGWAPAPPPPRPGCVPLRPLTLSDILDGSFRVIRRNPAVMVGLSAAVAVVQVLLVALFEVLAFAQFGSIRVTSASNPTAPTDLGPLLGGESVQLAGLLASTLLGAVLTGMLTIAVTQDVLGNVLSAARVWQRIRGRIGRLVWLAVLTTVLEFTGLLLFLAPGIWLWGIWAVAVPAMMVEGTGVTDALGRSKALVDGTFWRVWGIRAVGTVMVMVVSGFLVVPFELVGAALDGDVLSAHSGGAQLPLLFIALTAVGSALAATVTAPVKAAIDSLLYVDLRMRKEGLDLVLRQAVPAGAPQAPPPGPRTAF
jgi:hypothetical protein